MDGSEFFIVGANGQLGRALRAKYPSAKSADVNELDITNSASVESFDWSGVKVIFNAAAYTNVDGAETAEGKKAAWAVNAAGVANLSKIAKKYDMTLVHISTEYVFDGTKTPHAENEKSSPLSEYGKSKAAGDEEAQKVPKHYILRISWLIGEGKNFVRTMIGLAEKNVSPKVVNDQIGRLTFTGELVRAIDYLLTNQAPFGTYNVSNEGQPASWADITTEIFHLLGRDDLTVTGISTDEYYANKPEAAPRPLLSTLDLSKLEATGFKPNDWHDDLSEYIKKEVKK